MDTKKIILLGWLLAIPVIGFAQLVEITKHYPVQLPEGTVAFHPVLSNEGDKILITSQNYTGLSVLDLSTDVFTRISEEEGAGYEPKFDTSGKEVYYKAVSREKGKRYKTLMNFNLQNKSDKRLSQRVRNISDLNNLEAEMLRAHSSSEGVQVTNENLEIVVNQHGVKRVLHPLQEKIPGYIWASLSPDGTKIVFTAVSRGTYICDLSGNVLQRLGAINSPVWYGDSYVVGMEDKDNGEVVTESSIVIYSVETDKKQTLTSPDRVALYPAVSYPAGKIAYTTDKGKLFIMELTINH